MDLTSLTEGVKGLIFGSSSKNEESSNENKEKSPTTNEATSKSTPNSNSTQNSESESPNSKKKRGAKKKTPVNSPNSRQTNQSKGQNHEFEALDHAPAIPLVGENGESIPLRTRIMKQLEHYFSDENLNKDKFLIKEFEKDESGQGYINLEVLAGFPRMRAMTPDIDEIRNAVRESTIIKLSKNGEKVKRVVPFALPLTEEQKERRTVYVSYLPKNSDQESVRGIFGICGVIKRIDLPVDKKSGEIKGIAFVEFESRKQARKALAYFSDKNNDFFKLGMRVRQYATKSGSQPTSPEALSPMGQSPGSRGNGFLGAGFQMTPEMIQQFQEYGYIVTPQPNVVNAPFVPYNQNVLFPQQSPPFHPHGAQNSGGNQHNNSSSNAGHTRGGDRDHHHGGNRQHSNSFSHSHNRGDNQNGGNSHHNAPNSSVGPNSSIYESAPTFNYSKQNDKRKKRSVSQPPGVNPESGHHLPGLGHVHHSQGPTLQHSSSGERPRLQLRPRSESVGAGSGIVPSRQPKGPDGSKGFPAGRGKLISNQ